MKSHRRYFKTNIFAHASARLRQFTSAAAHQLPRIFPPRLLRIAAVSFLVSALSVYTVFAFQPSPAADASDFPALSIPSIGLETPVQPLQLEAGQLHAPDTIAGSYSSHRNKIFIIGHSSTVFAELHEVDVNTVFTYAGHSYQITHTETIEKSAIDMREILADTPVETIIIMTCAGTPLPDQDATHRFILTAKLIESES